MAATRKFPHHLIREIFEQPQLFAYHVAAKRGLDVDHSRNLVKAVTLE